MSRIVVTTIVRLWDSPAATAVTALCSPLTMTGVRLPVVVPLPSWPSWLLPQARTWRIHVSARLWKPPPAMEVTVVPGRDGGDGGPGGQAGRDRNTEAEARAYAAAVSELPVMVCAPAQHFAGRCQCEAG